MVHSFFLVLMQRYIYTKLFQTRHPHDFNLKISHLQVKKVLVDHNILGYIYLLVKNYCLENKEKYFAHNGLACYATSLSKFIRK